jgi:hypothetical protein
MAESFLIIGDGVFGLSKSYYYFISGVRDAIAESAPKQRLKTP